MDDMPAQQPLLRMEGISKQFPGGQARGAIDILVAYLRDNKEPEQHDTYLTPRSSPLIISVRPSAPRKPASSSARPRRPPARKLARSGH